MSSFSFSFPSPSFFNPSEYIQCSTFIQDYLRSYKQLPSLDISIFPTRTDVCLLSDFAGYLRDVLNTALASTFVPVLPGGLGIYVL